MIENIAIIDTETTGLYPNKNQMIEIAVILYNLKHKAVLQSFSTLIRCDENPVEHINGISPASTQCKMAHTLVPEILLSIISHADAIVAHNAPFDKGFVIASKLCQYFDELPWICTVRDFDWGKPLLKKKLENVCDAFGIPYVNAHRAMSDCTFMVNCFNKIEDLHERMNLTFDKVKK